MFPCVSTCVQARGSGMKRPSLESKAKKQRKTQRSKQKLQNFEVTGTQNQNSEVTGTQNAQKKFEKIVINFTINFGGKIWHQFFWQTFKPNRRRQPAGRNGSVCGRIFKGTGAGQAALWCRQARTNARPGRPNENQHHRPCSTVNLAGSNKSRPGACGRMSQGAGAGAAELWRRQARTNAQPRRHPRNQPSV